MPWYLPLVFIGGIAIGAISFWIFYAFTRIDQIDKDQDSYLGSAVLSLVRNDTEAALQNLIQLLNKNTDNVDAYMALSNLYRTKGWFNRAIDIRRRLLSRTTLRPHQRRAIMLEMVNDFQQAGLLDRAVTSMRELLDLTDPTPSDYSLLATLYEKSGNLQDAHDSWKKAGNSVNQAYLKVALAQKCQSKDDMKGMRKHLGSALKLHKDNPAALLLLAELNARSGKIKQAEKFFEALQNVRPDLTGVIADTLEKLSNESENKRLQEFFVKLLESQTNKPRVAVRYADWLIRQNKHSQAAKLLNSIETRSLAPEMMVRYVEACARCDNDALTAKKGLEAMHRFMDNKRFVCHSCKELIPTLEWKCPRCNAWGTLRSRTTYSESGKGM